MTDTSLQFPHVHVIPASAGAGKTYTLAHRYVQFLLSEAIPSSGFRNILAITFTKMAAKEMKERIVLLLKQIALRDEKALQTIAGYVALPPDVLQKRASELTAHILGHYSDFNVRTIDSFLNTVFTASAMELGVLPNVDLQFDQEEVIASAFRIYSQRLTEGSNDAQILEELIRLIEGQEFSSAGFLWNPFTKIQKEVRQLQKEFGRFPQDPVVVDHRERLTALERSIVTDARKLIGMLTASSLPVNSYFKKDVQRLADGDVNAIASKGVWKKYFNKYSDDDGAAQEIRRLFAVINPLEKNLEEYLRLYSRQYYHPFVRAVTLLAETIREVKLMKGVVVIDDVNRSLARYLSDAVVPEVYLKLGERIAHFMIDEFQDTSPIQWKNLFPLIEEAVSKQGSFFAVGDTKQSIYGFRGADWRIFRDLRDGRYFPSAPLEELPLTTNYRSAQALVTFVRTVFSAHIAAAGLEAQARASGLYAFAQEVPEHAMGKGYVVVRRFQHSAETSSADEHKQFLIGILRDCSARGYAYRDMAILTPANADVVEISSWLNADGIPFLSLSTLDIRKRPVIGEVIALLRFLDSPIDDLSFFTVISGSILRCNEPAFTAETVHAFAVECRLRRVTSDYRLFRDLYPAVWERYFERLFALVGYMPLYDIVSEVIKTFRLFERCPGEESALVKLLECVKQFERSGSNSLKDFLRFSGEEGGDPWSIEVPQNIDAVRVMTIHKAKGLGFPVVLVSLTEKRNTGHSFLTKESEEGIEVLKVNKGYGERSKELGELYTAKEAERTIDDLNKIYVALTRARQEMYISVNYKNEENLPASILPAMTMGSKYLQAERERMETSLPSLRSLYRMESVPVPTAAYRKIGIDETHRGDLIHGILAEIESLEEDLHASVEHAVGRLPVTDRTAGLREREAIMEFLRLESVRVYFDHRSDRTILREQEFVAPNGRLYRMDRVIVDPESVVVVDFKTGGDEHHEEYAEQVKNYMALLKDVFPGREVSGALLYVDLRKGVPVR